MPDVFVEDGSGGELGDFGLLGLGTEAIAFPTRDFGFGLCLHLTAFEPRIKLVG